MNPRTITTPKKVQVGGYTYETDLPVKVGDEVLLPTADFLRDVLGNTWKGTVTSLESDYDGPCRWIIKITKKRRTTHARPANHRSRNLDRLRKPRV